MERRLKQFIFGLLYILVFSGIGYLVFSAWVPKPTCNDNKLNQDEEGIDCGGSCAPCQQGASLVIKQNGAFAIKGTNRTSFLMEVTNPSSDLWVENFSYAISIYNILGVRIPVTTGTASVPPGGSRKIIVVGVNIDARDISRIEPKISNIKWSDRKNFVSESISLSGVKTEKMSDQTVRVRGTVNNTSSDFKAKVVVGAILRDDSLKAINISQTTVENLAGFSNGNFEIFFPATEKTYNPGLTDVFFETIE